MKKEEKSLIAAELGRRGGLKTAKKGKEYMRELGRKGGKNRWDKQKKLSTDEAIDNSERSA